jgi:hypothetical protein
MGWGHGVKAEATKGIIAGTHESHCVCVSVCVLCVGGTSGTAADAYASAHGCSLAAAGVLERSSTVCVLQCDYPAQPTLSTLTLTSANSQELYPLLHEQQYPTHSLYHYGLVRNQNRLVRLANQMTILEVFNIPPPMSTLDNPPSERN